MNAFILLLLLGPLQEPDALRSEVTRLQSEVALLRGALRERDEFLGTVRQELVGVREDLRELAMVSLPGTTVEKFYFTVHDDAVADKISRAMGRRVSLHYDEKVGLPTSCFGDTRYFVRAISDTPDIPIGPGVVLPNVAPASAPAAPR